MKCMRKGVVDHLNLTTIHCSIKDLFGNIQWLYCSLHSKLLQSRQARVHFGVVSFCVLRLHRMREEQGGSSASLRARVF